jgi:hypothetical protein
LISNPRGFLTLDLKYLDENLSVRSHHEKKLLNSGRIALLCLLSGLFTVQAMAADSQLQDLPSVNQAQQSDDLSVSATPVVALDEIEQVNSVSQLSDVQPKDWAFGALQS